MKEALRDVLVYLEDIRHAIERIGEYTAEGKQVFLHDEKTQDAVILQIAIIGEAASKLPKSLKDQHPEIPWKDAIAMRNILIHDYSDRSIQRVWDTIEEDLPPLKKTVEVMLERRAA